MKRAFFGLAMMSVMVSQSAIAASCWPRAASEAAQVKQFDIMLMVSTIRCFRQGVDFSGDYNQFVRGKRAVLRGVGDEMIRHMNGSMGGKAAMVAYDKLSVVMANKFGDGVDGFGCEDIKAIVIEANASEPSRDHLVGLAQRVGMEPPLPDPRCDLPTPPVVVATAPVSAPPAASAPPLVATIPVSAEVAPAPAMAAPAVLATPAVATVPAEPVPAVAAAPVPAVVAAPVPAVATVPEVVPAVVTTGPN